MEALQLFKDIVPYLTHPLVLIGFVVLLFFWVLLRGVLNAKIIPTLSKSSGARLAERLLRYGFIIALVVIVLGFGSQFLDRYLASEPRVDVEAIVAQLESSHRGQFDALRSNYDQEVGKWREQAKAAVAALARQEGPGIDEALARLAEGNTAAAEEIFKAIEERKTAEGVGANKAAAEAARHLGALAYFHDTQAAIDAYRRATVLDPDNAEAWIGLGAALIRIGKLAEADTVLRRVVALGQDANDPVVQAMGLGNLAVIYTSRGDLAQAEDMLLEELALFEPLDRKGDMAISYSNLGTVYELRDKPDQAAAMYLKALAINKELRQKDGMAANYFSLANVYVNRGNLDQAEALYQTALTLFESTGTQEHIQEVTRNYLLMLQKIRQEMADGDA